MEQASAHLPVLLNEVIELLQVRPDGRYIDATFGRGGHSRALLGELGPTGELVVIDRDPEALAHAHQLARDDRRVTVADARFSLIADVVDAGTIGFHGIFFDIGLSSPQVDNGLRGFSFRYDAPLDMRMDPRYGETAASWLADASEKELSDALWQYGEERRSRQIARRIVEQRQLAPLRTTFELANLVRSCFPHKGGRIDPATRTFQAIRIVINDELGELERAIERALKLLAIGGRLLVIAFHSLEDRIVKLRFRALDDQRRAGGDGPCYRLVKRKPVMASRAETALNPRARSARLRTLERCA